MHWLNGGDQKQFNTALDFYAVTKKSLDLTGIRIL